MEEFKVGLYYEERGHIIIKAETKEQAEAIACNILEEDGLPDDFRASDRDYGTTAVTVIEERVVSGRANR